MAKNFDLSENLTIKFLCRHPKYVPFESTYSFELKNDVSLKKSSKMMSVSKKYDFYRKKFSFVQKDIKFADTNGLNNIWFSKNILYLFMA